MTTQLAVTAETTEALLERVKQTLATQDPLETVVDMAEATALGVCWRVAGWNLLREVEALVGIVDNSKNARDRINAMRYLRVMATDALEASGHLQHVDETARTLGPDGKTQLTQHRTGLKLLADSTARSSAVLNTDKKTPAASAAKEPAIAGEEITDASTGNGNTTSGNLPGEVESEPLAAGRHAALGNPGRDLGGERQAGSDPGRCDDDPRAACGPRAANAAAGALDGEDKAQPQEADVGGEGQTPRGAQPSEAEEATGAAEEGESRFEYDGAGHRPPSDGGGTGLCSGSW